jgi:nucleoside-diphosphate-sugar epimerase
MTWMYDAIIRGTKVLYISIEHRFHLNMLIISQSDQELLTGSGWVDVRDLATAHRLALEKPAAGGERLIVTAESYHWQDWRKLSPSSNIVSG